MRFLKNRRRMSSCLAIPGQPSSHCCWTFKKSCKLFASVLNTVTAQPVLLQLNVKHHYLLVGLRRPSKYHYLLIGLDSHQRRNERYTGMHQRVQTRLITYYRFLSGHVHSSSSFCGKHNSFAKLIWQNPFGFGWTSAFYCSLFHLKNFRGLALKIFTIVKT